MLKILRKKQMGTTSGYVFVEMGHLKRAFEKPL
jgi:hypothetical protein